MIVLELKGDSKGRVWHYSTSCIRDGFPYSVLVGWPMFHFSEHQEPFISESIASWPASLQDVGAKLASEGHVVVDYDVDMGLEYETAAESICLLGEKGWHKLYPNDSY